MRYVKSIGVGLVAAALFAVAFVLLEGLVWTVIVARRSGAASGGFGTVSSGLALVSIPALFGFVLGFWWQFRRQPA